jgi:hypothetical protein
MGRKGQDSRVVSAREWAENKKATLGWLNFQNSISKDNKKQLWPAFLV